ncbi:hypothetical protein ACFL59_09760 [Planctomycetota bacterium]
MSCIRRWAGLLALCFVVSAMPASAGDEIALLTSPSVPSERQDVLRQGDHAEACELSRPASERSSADALAASPLAEETGEGGQLPPRTDRLEKPGRACERHAGTELNRRLRNHHEWLLETAERRRRERQFLGLLSWLNRPPALPRDSRHDLDLRRGCTVDPTYAVVEYKGIQRYAVGRIQSALDKLYLLGVESRVREKRVFWLDEYLEAQEAIRPDEASRSRFAMPFPYYWSEHPARVESLPVVTCGERIELWRLGPISVTNDLKVRNRGRLRVFELGASEPRRRGIEARTKARALRHDVASRRDQPIRSRRRSLLWDCLRINGRGRVTVSQNDVRLIGKLDVHLLLPDLRVLPTWQLEVRYAPVRGEAELSLAFRLFSF